jgi:hypothetical protein
MQGYENESAIRGYGELLTLSPCVPVVVVASLEDDPELLRNLGHLVV